MSSGQRKCDDGAPAAMSVRMPSRSSSVWNSGTYHLTATGTPLSSLPMWTVPWLPAPSSAPTTTEPPLSAVSRSFELSMACRAPSPDVLLGTDRRLGQRRQRHGCVDLRVDVT